MNSKKGKEDIENKEIKLKMEVNEEIDPLKEVVSANRVLVRKLETTNKTLSALSQQLQESNTIQIALLKQTQELAKIQAISANMTSKILEVVMKYDQLIQKL